MIFFFIMVEDFFVLRLISHLSNLVVKEGKFTFSFGMVNY